MNRQTAPKDMRRACAMLQSIFRGEACGAVALALALVRLKRQAQARTGRKEQTGTGTV